MKHRLRGSALSRMSSAVLADLLHVTLVLVGLCRGRRRQGRKSIDGARYLVQCNDIRRELGRRRWGRGA